MLLATLAVVGGIWHSLHWNWIGCRDLATFVGEENQPVVVRGRVSSQPRWIAADRHQERYSRERGVRSRMVVNITAIRDQGKFRRASGKVVTFVDGKVDGVGTGDEVEFAGKLSVIRPTSNPGEYNLRSFFRGKRTFCWMNLHSPDVLKSRPAGNPVTATASFVRVSLDSLLREYLGNETAPLASAMLLGNRDLLDRSTRDHFMLSGTVHLLAISGLHVGILAGLFCWLPRTRIISRRQGLVLTVLFVLAYAWLVEFRPPVTRAAILISVYCGCRWIGRTPFSFNTLALAALVILIVNPAELFGAGAQLSFLAVASLIFARQWIIPHGSDDPIDRLIETTRPWNERLLRYTGDRIYMAMAGSAFIWIFAVPAVATQFHVVAPIALLANPFLLIPIAIGLSCGLGIVVFGFWLPPLARLMATGCESSLQWIQSTVNASVQIPLGHWWTSGPSTTAVIGFYLILVIVFVRFHGIRFHWLAGGFLLWVVACWLAPNWLHQQAQCRRDTLRCTVMDVGHGGCVLLELPKGKNMLYDCGSFGSPRKAQRSASGVLWDQGIRRLDAVVISHADSDHFNGLPALAARFAIDQVIVSDRFLHHLDGHPMALAMLDDLREKGVSVRTVHCGDLLDFGSDVSINVLSPPPSGFPGSNNANSIVLEIEYRGKTMLLPGDLEREGLDQLLETGRRDYDIVMTPHHGSSASRPVDFLEWCEPEVAITSCRRGKNVELSELNSDFRDRMFLHTGYDGAVQVAISSNGVAVRTWRDDPW